MPETAVRPQKRAEGLQAVQTTDVMVNYPLVRKLAAEATKERRTDLMTILVTIQAQLVVGEEQVIKSLAPEGMLAAVFEDDGRTGYFYALDESVEGNPIMDAVHIYNAEDVSDGHIPSDVKIGWSEDSQKCVLLINGYRTGHLISWEKRVLQEWLSSPINKVWSLSGHEWSDSVDDFSGELRQAIACHYGSNNGCYGKSDSLAGTAHPAGLFCNAYEETTAA